MKARPPGFDEALIRLGYTITEDGVTCPDGISDEMLNETIRVCEEFGVEITHMIGRTPPELGGDVVVLPMPKGPSS